MTAYEFTWDNRKNTSNQKKHGISFDEAKSVFYDEYARLIADPDHSEEEDRYILLGLSSQLKCLVICHCYRESGELVRIISARKASKSERKQYEGFLHER